MSLLRFRGTVEADERSSCRVSSVAGSVVSRPPVPVPPKSVFCQSPGPNEKALTWRIGGSSASGSRVHIPGSQPPLLQVRQGCDPAGTVRQRGLSWPRVLFGWLVALITPLLGFWIVSLIHLVLPGFARETSWDVNVECGVISQPQSISQPAAFPLSSLWASVHNTELS